MKLREVVDKLSLDVRCCDGVLDGEINTGYASDLLSDVLGNSDENDLWITLQIHPNIVAVASMKGLAGIVLINGRDPEEDTIAKAKEENIPIMVSEMTAFEFCGRLYALGVCGTQGDEGL